MKDVLPIFEIDKCIGCKIRNRRLILGITQKDLGEAINVSAQQIQKYESAANRVSSSTLYNLSKFLCVPMDFFFSNFDKPKNLFLAEEQAKFDHNDNIPEKEMERVVNLYKLLNSEEVKKVIGQFVMMLKT